MNSYRSILSLLLLSAYALLLLHDFIPHTHHNYKADVQISSTVHHSHGDHHHHAHDHHDEEDDTSPESSDSNSLGDHLIHTHSHSLYDGHHHELVHRATAKIKLISSVDADQHLLADLWQLPDHLYRNNSWQFVSLPPPFDPHLSSGHGLRAPPALG